MGYTTHAGCDLAGLGVSAISHIGGSFSQNHRELPKWEAALDQGHLPVARGLELSADDIVRADVIQQLMCHGEVDIRAVERQYSVDFSKYFSEALQRLHRMVADGLAICEPTAIRATPRGRLLLRALAMCFDHYLAPAAAAPHPAFSKIL